MYLLKSPPQVTALLPASFDMDAKVRAAHRLIDEAVETYKVSSVWALLSGGHDSVTVTHVTSRHPRFAGVIHINTGTGLEETESYVSDTCRKFGWPLLVMKPNTTYEQLLVKYGFPGPSQHSLMYNMLKGRPLRQAKQSVSHGARIGFSTGVRSQESERRMGNVDRMRKDDEGIWINPIHDWSAFDCTKYMSAYAIPRNPVKDKMHLSGECFCGSYAGSNEYRELDAWFPHQARRIDAWESLVKIVVELGLNQIDAKYCKWGHSRRTADEQMEMFPLCQYCTLARGA